MKLHELVEEAAERWPDDPIPKVIRESDLLERTGTALSQSLHKSVLAGGRSTRRIADVLHGTWLGHPAHPVLTDVTIGAWVLGVIFDVLGEVWGEEHAKRMGDRLAAAGTIAAVPTLITGLADYSTVPKKSISTATLHALINDVNFGLYLLSLRDRRLGNRRRGVYLSALAVALTFLSAWLGGKLVYRDKVGVNHAPLDPGPNDWTPAIEANTLPEMKPARVTVGGTDVLLYRCEGAVHAVAAVCSHAGGPLDEGTFDGCHVQCPWHDSVFDLRSGSVRHGPATHPQPVFETRIRAGSVEIRRLRHGN